MTLSKRALLVIFPVLLFSYCIAAVITYYSLYNTTSKLEQNRLDLAATELSTTYDQYITFAESYLLALTESEAFRRYINKHEKNLFSHISLSTSIEKTIQGFEQHKSDKLSFAIHKNSESLEQEFFFELSNDPFSDIDDELHNFIKQTQLSKTYRQTGHITSAKKPFIIAVSKVIDRNTFTLPHPTQIDNSVIATFSLIPTKFIDLKENIELNYGVRVETHRLKSPADEKKHKEEHKAFPDLNHTLFAEALIDKDLVVHIHVPQGFLDNQLFLIRTSLIIISLLFFLASSFMLYVLLNRYVTHPITTLENELSDVISGNKNNIDIRSSQSNEIGRLERTFNQLYGDLNSAYKKTKELSERDSLTELHNVSYISEHTSRLLYQAQKEKHNIAFIYIDLDNFKFVNDTFGHSTGDQLLRAFAHKLKGLCQREQMLHHETIKNLYVGRISGDEFSIVVEFISDQTKELPYNLASKVLSIFKDGFHCERGTFPVSASIGISCFPSDGHTLSQLVNNADNAMYHAKNSGKNQVSFYSKEIATKARRLKDIEYELKSLTPDEEFHLVYMPLVCTKTRRITGFEVLIRWISPTLGFVGPDEFIPISESFGLFPKIDLWVVEQAFKEYAQLKERLGYDFKLSINLSSAQLNRNQISVDLIVLANKYNIQPENIQLEMTETLNVEYTANADILLKVLSAQGFNIAIDDFGTGYTALLQLIEYPAQMIKFDKTFIDKSMEDNNRTLLPPLIAICHSQGLKVTAEGVETEEIANYLTHIGCDYLQGYFFGKPLKLNEMPLTHSWHK